MEKFNFTTFEEAEEIFYNIKTGVEVEYGYHEEDGDCDTSEYDSDEDSIMRETCDRFEAKYGWEHIVDVEEYFENKVGTSKK